MNQKLRRILILLIAAVLLTGVIAYAEGVISTSVVLRVSKMTQNAVVNVGEDLSMEVNIDGVVPASYQWYFGNAAIEGANQKVYNIVNAQIENTGIYRLDAFDENGKMLVSMDISARVIDNSVPKSGDASMPVWIAYAVLAACGVVVLGILRRRVRG